MTVEIYTKPSCTYCVQAKRLLNEKGIAYKEYTVGAEVTKDDIQARVNSLGLNTKVSTVPQIFFTDKNGVTHHVGGYTNLLEKQAILDT